jgi:hypothetical protein
VVGHRHEVGRPAARRHADRRDAALSHELEAPAFDRYSNRARPDESMALERKAESCGQVEDGECRLSHDGALQPVAQSVVE